MNIFQTTSFPTKVRRRIGLTAAALLLMACGFVAGCGTKDADTASVTPTSQKGQAPVVPTGEVKGTPEQEAAKAKAMQQGPAIQAANEAAARGGK